MSMPKIPDINPNICIDREDAINIIITSIAMEELALAHILNAEGEKLQYVLGTLHDNTPEEVTICDIMAVNKSVQKMLEDVIKAEMLLSFKLDHAIELDENKEECTTSICGTKIWRDGNNIYKTRPATVRIDLLRDGVAYKSVDIDSMGNGAYSFKCLPVYKSFGVKYDYTIDELHVPAGYTRRVDGFNVINTAQRGTRTVDGVKTWAGDTGMEDSRPEKVTVNLFRNNIKQDPIVLDITVGGGNVYPFSFKDQPRFDDEGEPYTYSVDEEEIEDYRKDISGFNILNTYVAP